MTDIPSGHVTDYFAALFLMGIFFGLEFSAFSRLIAQALCALFASLLATGLVAATSGQRFRGMDFPQRFAFILWRYTLPAGVFSLAMYWLVFGRAQ